MRPTINLLRSVANPSNPSLRNVVVESVRAVKDLPKNRSRPHPHVEKYKITIVGLGNIGSAFLKYLVDNWKSKTPIDIAILSTDVAKAQKTLSDIQAGSGEHSSKSGSPQNLPNNTNLRAHCFHTEAEEAYKDTNAVIVTAGVPAGLLKSSVREASLPFVYNILENIANDIKRFAPSKQLSLSKEGVLVVTVTNPVEIATHILNNMLQGHTSNIYGTGTELDGRRFRAFLRAELNKKGIEPKAIEGEVIGGHTDGAMIFTGIKINGTPYKEYQAANGISSEEIEQIVSRAKNLTKKEGFDVVDKTGTAASYALSAILTNLVQSFLVGNKKPLDLTLSVPFINGGILSDYVVIPPTTLSIPVTVTRDNIDKRPITLSEEELEALVNTSSNIGKTYTAIDTVAKEQRGILNNLTLALEQLKNREHELKQTMQKFAKKEQYLHNAYLELAEKIPGEIFDYTETSNGRYIKINTKTLPEPIETVKAAYIGRLYDILLSEMTGHGDARDAIERLEDGIQVPNTQDFKKLLTKKGITSDRKNQTTNPIR